MNSLIERLPESFSLSLKRLKSPSAELIFLDIPTGKECAFAWSVFARSDLYHLPKCNVFIVWMECIFCPREFLSFFREDCIFCPKRLSHLPQSQLSHIQALQASFKEQNFIINRVSLNPPPINLKKLLFCCIEGRHHPHPNIFFSCSLNFVTLLNGFRHEQKHFRPNIGRKKYFCFCFC